MKFEIKQLSSQDQRVMQWAQSIKNDKQRQQQVYQNQQELQRQYTYQQQNVNSSRKFKILLILGTGEIMKFEKP